MSPSTGWRPAADCDTGCQCILVVEDEPLVRFILSDGLRDEGYRVIEACNADEALTFLSTALPDLIVSDVRMPGSVDGMGLLAMVRDMLPGLPVIITSGHLNPTQALSDGATQFVAKPYRMEAVIELVQKALGEAE